MERKVIPIKHFRIDNARTNRKKVDKYYFNSTSLALSGIFLKKEILQIWNAIFMELLFKSSFRNVGEMTSYLIKLLQAECDKRKKGTGILQIEALHTCYKFFDASPTVVKKAISLDDDYRAYPTALEQLDRFCSSQKDLGNTFTVQLIEQIYFSCERKYLELTKDSYRINI